ncbi:protein serine/threonine kinase, putative [Entamoeba invadens IP1]|uniref:Protein serine/threonine kinase, putative n=1 Tax=Entamoeba invadens IP1 TaxID=370355 RepID=L7FP09_ENTIV|nr:protein serine/threonine kinase, putative [Entamoeba invadens IP1]ELP94361.1 protein serine/threonine kinase, putative [Entamoeba invadens IP1]|eukprot:XP_004261132.1 protein serine/threonine kinase, putative [Entamoeba invadens IP1]
MYTGFIIKQHKLVDGRCQLIEKCILAKNNRCFKCALGYTLNKRTCEKITNCIVFQHDGKCKICNNVNSNVLNVNGSCIVTVEPIIITKGSNIISCQYGYYVNSDLNSCEKCSLKYDNSVYCENGKPTKCEFNTEMISSGKCEIINYNFNDENGKHTNTISNCLYIINAKCVECDSNYILSQNKCETNNNNKCIEQNSFGCQRCNDSFYFDEQTNTCEQCDDNCLTCYKKGTQCLSCHNGKFLTNYECRTNEELKKRCYQFASFKSGCVVCQDGYYRLGLDCFKCNEKCSTCNNRDTCLTCNATNYKTNSGECKPQSSIDGCDVEVTQNGCSKCQTGYLTINSNECQKCDDSCKTCSLTSNRCTSCESYRVLSSNSSCVGLSQITKCNEITDSKCSKCAFWSVPSSDGMSCESQVVWWVILIAVLIVILVVILVAVIIIIITKKVRIFILLYFKMEFVFLLKKIDYNSDCEEISVTNESRQLFCVGNTNKNLVKIQFTVLSNSDKFDIRVDPEIVILKSGYACEFSIYLTPHCTCKIDNSLQIISKCLKTNEEKFNEIHVIGTTEQSTRIDYDELTEDKKLGQGSFGIVYKGTFRGNDVAIKKMKTVIKDNAFMDEFNNEVSMLDKFRSEYIVHFYGAVFIPNKLCMVTEYAAFGSLQDLIVKRQPEEIDMKMRVKMLLDAANGISYLHENGILHRDVKPDNILVVSLDNNSKVNAKLTDFGSARNVNMMMTNMTFTKGIGTPKYMAPENQFKYAWDIVDFVVNGKRLVKPSDMNNDLYMVVTKMWCSDPQQRLNVQTVIEQLENIITTL